MSENQEYDEHEEIECNECMLDLETLGTRPGSAVVSIGAVMFNREQSYVGPTFYQAISLENLIDVFGFAVSGSTIRFWLQQEDAARNELFKDTINVNAALMEFARFVTDSHEGGVDKELQVWGNGAAFDNVLLREMYERMHLQPPWAFWNDRCYRTIKNERDKGKNLAPNVASGNVHHKALDDALWQTYHLLNMDAGYRKFDEIVDGRAQLEMQLESND